MLGFSKMTIWEVEESLMSYRQELKELYRHQRTAIDKDVIAEEIDEVRTCIQRVRKELLYRYSERIALESRVEAERTSIQ
jgi:hypothetical protein